MPEIQSSDPGRKLQERYDLTGGTPAPFLSPEIVPVVLVDDLTASDVLDRAFEREAFVWNTEGGGVAENSVCMFVNPVESGVLATVQRISVGVAADAVVSIERVVSTFVDSGGFRRFRDTRIPGLPVCGGQHFTSAPALIQDMQWQVEAPAAGNAPLFPLVLELDETIGPGFGLSIRNNAVNESLDCQIWFKERVLI